MSVTQQLSEEVQTLATNRVRISNHPEQDERDDPHRPSLHGHAEIGGKRRQARRAGGDDKGAVGSDHVVRRKVLAESHNKYFRSPLSSCTGSSPTPTSVDRNHTAVYIQLPLAAVSTPSKTSSGPTETSNTLLLTPHRTYCQKATVANHQSHGANFHINA
jgi:hypothetical protein